MGFAAALPLGTYKISSATNGPPNKWQNTFCVANKGRIRDIRRPFKGRDDCGYFLHLAETWNSPGRVLFPVVHEQ